MIIVTMALAIGTFYMAGTTHFNIIIQKQQFAYTNQAKINLKELSHELLIIGDSVKEGIAILENYCTKVLLY